MDSTINHSIMDGIQHLSAELQKIREVEAIFGHGFYRLNLREGQSECPAPEPQIPVISTSVLGAAASDLDVYTRLDKAIAMSNVVLTNMERHYPWMQYVLKRCSAAEENGQPAFEDPVALGILRSRLKVTKDNFSYCSNRAENQESVVSGTSRSLLLETK
jgi:hypothetical protein